nr:hypothetical protein GCM10020093_039260 [Planobispora longispora]
MRVMLCDDSALFRRGVALLLEGVGVEVTGQARDVAELTTLMRGHLPDAVILGIRMPPTFTDEGLTGAAELRAAHPRLGVLVLSTYAETAYAQRLLEIGPRGVGYLLKDRVDDAAAIRDALTRVIDGESVVDGEIISRLFARKAASPRPADRAGALRPDPDGGGPLQPGDQPPAAPRRQDGRGPHRGHLRQAGPGVRPGRQQARAGRTGLDPVGGPETPRRPGFMTDAQGSGRQAGRRTIPPSQATPHRQVPSCLIERMRRLTDSCHPEFMLVKGRH